MDICGGGEPTCGEHDRACDEHLEWLQAAARLSETTLARVWDNPEDDVYNDLT